MPLRVVVLSKQHVLYKVVADWGLAETEITVHDSPSEALAMLADGRAALFLFDTTGFHRTGHVIDKFLTLKGDADLIVIGEPAVLAGRDDLAARSGVVRRLDPGTDPGELRREVERLLLLRRIRQRSGIVGRSRAVTQMLTLIAQAAPLDVTVLIQGESGTGKELVARAIHQHSTRSTGPFVGLNCGAIGEGVLESELFGHVRGAFTGAVQHHRGVFQRADKGTLFLDEVGEMPLAMQTRFLRALETGEFTPVGGARSEHSDTRLIAATNRDLASDVEQGRFRADLYYRLRVVVIPTPPLRERIEDLPILAHTFLEQENRRHGLAVRGFSREALGAMIRYPWPGNIRELRNQISSLVVLKQRGLIELDDLPAEILSAGQAARQARLPVPSGGTGELDSKLLLATLIELRRDMQQIKDLLTARDRVPPAGMTGLVDAVTGASGGAAAPITEAGDLRSAERQLIEAALRATGGHRREAAQRLGISERTLYRKLRRYGLG